MRTLFFIIIGVVFLVGHLIFPDDIGFSDTIIPTTDITSYVSPTQVPTPTSPPENPMPAAAADGDDDDVPVIHNPDKNEAADSSSTDPVSIFGDAKVTDTFERGSSGFGINAGLNDDENIRIISINNQLSLQPKKNSGWLTWRLRPPVVADSASQMEFSLITCARGDRTGIMMRTNDYTSGKGYYFSLACEGTVSILRDTEVLDAASAQDVFKNSSGDINVMTAIAYGNRLTLVLNGKTLLTVTDDTYTEGYSGFFTAPQGENTLTMNIQSFKEFYHQ